MSNYDIVIVGSGTIGATAALALAQQTTLKIAVIESQASLASWELSPQYDHRVSAISLASKRIWENLGIWNSICAKRFNPYVKMRVFDEAGSGEIYFDSDEINVPVLGYIIEDNVLRASLIEKMQNIDLLQPLKLVSLEQYPEKIELTTDTQQKITAKLLVAADGANSWVREQLGIELKTWDYGQTAIVSTVQTELPHEKTAWQRFLSTGPLAFLPLDDACTSSIVWSAEHGYAKELMQLSDADFQEKLTAAFANRLGKITAVSKRYSFPLRMRHAKNYVFNRVALIGDAAHTIHPLAGQGVNLGLLDAVCLAEVVAAAHEKKRDFASLTTLRRYERARKADNLTLLAAVDAIKYLFSNERKTIKTVRNTGLAIVNRMSPLKNFFAHYALGNRNSLPTIARK